MEKEIEIKFKIEKKDNVNKKLIELGGIAGKYTIYSNGKKHISKL